MPDWLRGPTIGKASEISEVQRIIKQRNIHTICEEGRCPNRGECYSQRTATFLLMGPTCTRSCGFCQVDKGHAPMPLDPDEPKKVAESVSLLGLKYVVLTSVTRDDISDGGASWFAETMREIRSANPLQTDRIQTVVNAIPVCYNHNIETVERLQGVVRRGAKYDRSLQVLAQVKQMDSTIATKSGIMLGHGESVDEVVQTLRDLRDVDCDRVTLGQYMRPSLEHLPVRNYWTPDKFDNLGKIATELGFKQVRSGPLVRSSYHAGEA